MKANELVNKWSVANATAQVEVKSHFVASFDPAYVDLFLLRTTNEPRTKSAANA